NRQTTTTKMPMPSSQVGTSGLTLAQNSPNAAPAPALKRGGRRIDGSSPPGVGAIGSTWTPAGAPASSSPAAVTRRVEPHFLQAKLRPTCAAVRLYIAPQFGLGQVFCMAGP